MSIKKAETSLQTLEMTGTKWDFFVAAINLFAEKGYTNVAVREIATELQVKAASMYNHFSSKDELLVTIYEFFTVNYEAALPDLDQLLELVSQIPPLEIFHQLKISFATDPQQLMRKIIYIFIEERNRDPRAKKLVDRVFMEVPRLYVKTILREMIAQKIIKPLDVDSIAALFSSLDFYASYAHAQGGKFALSPHEWETCHRYLFELIEPVEPVV